MNMFGKRVLNFDLLITCLTNIKHQKKNIILHKPFHLFFSTKTVLIPLPQNKRKTKKTDLWL